MSVAPTILGRSLLLVSFIVGATLFVSCGKHEIVRERRAPSVIEEAQSDSEGDPDERNEWFLFQRTYPGNSLPADARRKAWQHVLDSRREFQSQFETTAGGTGWRSIGPSPTFPFFNNIGLCSGRINAIGVSPSNSRIIIIGAATGGIWRSADGGNNFEPVTDDQVDLAVGSIAFSKSNPATVYAGMGDVRLGYLGSGVLRSTDEGQTWTRVSNGSLPSPGTISRIEVDPENANRVYVAMYSRLSGNTITSGGVYISNDGGVSWSRVLAGAARDVVVDTASARTLYAGLARIDAAADPAFGIYRSTDRGATWSIEYTAPPYNTTSRRDIRIAVSAANPQRIFAVVGGGLSFGLDVRFALSTDGGGSWTEQAATGFDVGQFGYNTYLVGDPRDANTIYLGTRDLYKSTDGGSNWTNLTHTFTSVGGFYEYTPDLGRSHADQQSFAFTSNNSNQFLIGNDGGIWKTADGGASFQSLNASLSLGLFTGVALHPTDPSITYGGTQDNGNQKRFSTTSSWFEFLGGDGGHTVLNPVDPSTVFVTYIRGNIFRFFNNGDFFDAQLTFDSTFGELGTPRMAFYPPFVGNGIDPTLYFGTWRLFISTDLGNSWTPPAGDTDLTKGLTQRGADVLTAIGVSRLDTRVIYTGSLMGRAMASTDTGASWRDISAGLPDRSITSITVDPGDSKTAYVTLSGFQSSHVFQTTDAGATWSDLSSGLPDIPVNAFLIDPINSNTFYAGTDIGVFRSINHGGTWRDFNRGLPPVVIHEFSAQSSGLIQIATYGRGIFELQGNQRPSVSSVVFDGKKKLSITGTGFGDAPRVLINGSDKSGKITSVSNTTIKVKGKSNKLALVPGDNTVQIVVDDVASLPFVFQP